MLGELDYIFTPTWVGGVKSRPPHAIVAADYLAWASEFGLNRGHERYRYALGLSQRVHTLADRRTTVHRWLVQLCRYFEVTFQVDDEDNPDCMTNAALCAWTIRSLKSRCCLPRTPCSRAWRQKFLGDGRSHCSGTFEREMDQVTERLAVHTHVTRSINVFLQRIESAFGLRFIRLSVHRTDDGTISGHR